MNKLFQLAEQRIELEKIRGMPIRWSESTHFILERMDAHLPLHWYQNMGSGNYLEFPSLPEYFKVIQIRVTIHDTIDTIVAKAKGALQKMESVYDDNL